PERPPLPAVSGRPDEIHPKVADHLKEVIHGALPAGPSYLGGRPTRARGTRAVPRLLSAYRIEVKLDVDVVVLARPPAAPRRPRPRLRRGRLAPGWPARSAAPAVGLHRPAQGQSVGVPLGGAGPAPGGAGLSARPWDA